jgi:protein O-GlcNAc transferase
MASISQAFAAARRLHREGRLAQAERGYREILAADPRHAGALELLGVIAHQAGRGDIAIQLIGRALAIEPASADAHVNLANVFKDRGELAAAIGHYRQALSLRPENPDYHYATGVVLQMRGDLDRAEAHYREALARRPDMPEARLNLGAIHSARGDLASAVTCFREALALRPDYLAAAMNLGVALARQGDRQAASEAFARAVAVAPDNAEAHKQLGISLFERGEIAGAAVHAEKAATLAPQDAEAQLNLGTALATLGRLSEAVAAYERALALRPGDSEAHLNLGTALREQYRLDEAAAHYRQALALDPSLAAAHYHLGLLAQDCGRRDDAVAALDRALALRPDYGAARLARCIADLPILYADEAEIARCRTAFREQLGRLQAGVERGDGIGELAQAVGSSQPFYLAYQQQNDRELRSLHGAMMCRIVEAADPAPALPAASPGARLRVGIVSGLFRSHAVWKIIIKGWVSRLDRNKFEVLGYHTGPIRDAVTEEAAAICDRFVRGPLARETWREAIAADRLDVLIYPEICMDPVTGWLAPQRLAPVQCTTWGHPETSGMATIDYFLSSEAQEPADGQAHYSEQLIQLPKLGIHYEPLDVERLEVAREEFGLRSGAVAFWCAQSLYKYLPRYDFVFPRIARESGDCQFVFFRFPHGDHVTALFRKRLDDAFATVGLSAADHCVFLPVLDQQRFIAASGLCDVCLDSIGWSGCTTTLESLTHDLPIVTLPGALMRGRHTMAMLQLMEVTETIAATEDEYIAMAVRLARDPSWRQALSNRIGKAKHRLYRDDSCIAALERFLLESAGRTA